MAKVTAPKTPEFRAEAKFQRGSPQKAKLVLDLIKGQRVEAAINTVAFTNKRWSPIVEKVLRSAVQNAVYISGEKGLDVGSGQIEVDSDRGAHENGLEDAVGVVPFGLVRTGAVEAPDPRFLASFDDPRLAPEERGGLRPVDPDVLGLVAHEFSCVPLLLRGRGAGAGTPGPDIPHPIAVASLFGPYFAAVSVM